MLSDNTGRAWCIESMCTLFCDITVSITVETLLNEASSESRLQAASNLAARVSLSMVAVTVESVDVKWVVISGVDSSVFPRTQSTAVIFMFAS